MFIHTISWCLFPMSQRPFWPPLSITPPVSFNLSQLDRKAAAQGNIDAIVNVGKMLLWGAHSWPTNLSVQPNPPEGLRWMFMAATNGNAWAYRYMAEANRQGLGTTTNMEAAYAWFKLSAESSPYPTGGRPEMNEMALNMDTAAIQRAVNLPAEWKAGRWQAPVIKVKDDSRLNLGGII